MDPIVGSALIGAGSSIISNLFSKRSNDSSNNQNLKIAQMNNEWSERMFQKQMDYNTAQWQRETAYNDRVRAETNEYNSAVNQAKRLREAGINPALAMTGANSGTSQGGSAPSGNSIGLPSPSSATVQPYRYDFSGVGNAIQSMVLHASTLQKNQAETNFINTQSDVLRAKASAEIAKLVTEEKGLRYDYGFRKTMESVRAANENEQYLSAVSSRLISEQQLKLMKQTEIMNELTITKLPEKMQAEISLLIAQANNLSLPEFSKELKFFEKRFNQRISKSDLKIIFDAWKGDRYNQQWRGVSPWSTAVSSSHELGKLIDDYLK